MGTAMHALCKRQIESNTKRFLSMVDDAHDEKMEKARIRKAYEAAHFAYSHATSVYSSEKLEGIFLDIAQNRVVDLSKTFEAGSVLHVMSEAYTSGGHTRCVERWIELADDSEKHSCVLLQQRKAYPDSLSEAVKKAGGTFYVWDPSMQLPERGIELRRLASGFEYVVLHIHPDDPTALIAFGTEEFKRPVIFFNHADHIFWLGVSIADCVADLSSHGRKASLEFRKATSSFVLGIPQELEPHSVTDKASARKQLGLKDDSLIVFTSGTGAKFIPVGSLAFFETMDFLLAKEERVCTVFIGPSPKENSYLKRLCQKYPERVFVYGKVDYHSEYLLKLAASDLVLDSFPVGGGTAVIDAIHAGKPVMTMNYGQSDFLTRTRAFCRSSEEFRQRSLRVLQSPGYARELLEEQRESLRCFNGPGVWKERLRKLKAALPKSHRVYLFDSTDVSKEPSDDQIVVCRWIQPDIIESFSMRRLLKILFTLTWNSRRKNITLLGINIINRRNDF